MRTSGIIVLLLLAASCGRVDADPPDGFARFKGDWSELRAVSPDGIIYRVRMENNEPEADLGFWQEALKKRMDDAGYAVVSDGALEGGAKGYLLELAAPVGQEDYSYLIGLYVQGDHLLIAEAAGEASRFAGRREAVVAAMKAAAD